MLDEAEAQLLESGCSDGKVEILKEVKGNFLKQSVFTNLSNQHSQIKL